ncbi:MAG: DUF554 domain-containing protein [Clostridia bacterium]|nr:DUF554 domain-containing protein [Clostridia bacterium]
MPAVFVNMAAVFAGSLIGLLCRTKIKKSFMDGIFTALALVTMVLGIISAIQTQNTLCLIICTAVGTACGTLLRLDDGIGSIGERIKNRFQGKAAGETRFTEGFVSATLLFCVGSMTIMGSLEASLHGDYSILFAKSALDFTSSIIFSATMGIGVMFSILPILVLQGGIVLAAGLFAPFLDAALVTEMSAVGGTILIGIAFNMLELSDKKMKVADMLPAIFLPILYLMITK